MRIKLIIIQSEILIRKTEPEAKEDGIMSSFDAIVRIWLWSSFRDY
jgi:hypothetical protein